LGGYSYTLGVKNGVDSSLIGNYRTRLVKKVTLLQKKLLKKTLEKTLVNNFRKKLLRKTFDKTLEKTF